MRRPGLTPADGGQDRPVGAVRADERSMNTSCVLKRHDLVTPNLGQALSYLNQPPTTLSQHRCHAASGRWPRSGSRSVNKGSGVLANSWRRSSEELDSRQSAAFG